MSTTRSTGKQQAILIVGLTALLFICACLIVIGVAGRDVWQAIRPQPQDEERRTEPATAELVVAVSPGMASTLQRLAEQFNRQAHQTPDGTLMTVRTLSLVPEKMVEQSLRQPSFQAIAPDSSLWLNMLDRQWAELQQTAENQGIVIPIGYQRFEQPIRYAISPVVIVAWESVARELGWPEAAIGWQTIQQQATRDPSFRWSHPSTGHASGLLATLAEFYAGAGITRGLTPEAATAESTLDYVRAVEATVRFYGEGEDVIARRLREEGRGFLDAFVAQEQMVLSWNQDRGRERLVAIYPAEGTLWADHPLALLVLGGADETPVTQNQRHTFQAFAQFLTSNETQLQFLEAGYRPTDLSIRLDQGISPFVGTQAADWRQPQTTLQIPSQRVVEVVQNVWWYTKRPTNIFLVVDTSGSMHGEKMALTRSALQTFVNQIRGDRDQVGLIEFSSSARLLRSLGVLDVTGRTELQAMISDLRPGGNTALIDGIWQAYTELQTHGDTEAINAIVVMTDGLENNSRRSMADLQRRLSSEEGVPIVIFTIAFGDDADAKLMRFVAEISGGQFYWATETDIEELYRIISTYF